MADESRFSVFIELAIRVVFIPIAGFMIGAVNGFVIQILGFGWIFYSILEPLGINAPLWVVFGAITYMAGFAKSA